MLQSLALLLKLTGKLFLLAFTPTFLAVMLILVIGNLFIDLVALSREKEVLPNPQVKAKAIDRQCSRWHKLLDLFVGYLKLFAW